MATSKVPVTLTYRKPGTQPPLFVAGTFSDPQWEAQEMQVTTGDDGEHTFSKPLYLPPGSQIQYKIRIGPGDWWVLNEDAPTVTDDAGNRNNLLVAPDSPDSSAKNDKPRNSDSTETTSNRSNTDADMTAAAHNDILPPPKPQGVSQLRDPREEELQQLTATPPEEVADTAAEVADTAKKLDAGKNGVEAGSKDTSNVCLIDNFPDDDDELDAHQHEPPPLFAHECLGAYDPVPEVVSPPVQRSREDRSGSVDYDVDKYDLNDPTIERWPSDRNAIMDAVRRVESSRDEDQTYNLGSPISPVISSRRASNVEEDINLSPDSSGSNSNPTKKLGVPTRKQSHGSMASNRSLASLASIVEEDGKRIEEEEDDEEAIEDLRPSPVVRMPSPAVKVTPDILGSPASDEDEGVVLKNGRSKADSKGPADASAPIPEIVTPVKQNEGKAQANAPIEQDTPSVRAQPPDEMDELEDDEADAGVGPAATPGRNSSKDGQVRRRNVSNDRSVTSSSIQGAKDADSGNWLRAFFRVLFVDWIGGFVSRLFHGQRK